MECQCLECSASCRNESSFLENDREQKMVKLVQSKVDFRGIFRRNFFYIRTLQTDYNDAAVPNLQLYSTIYNKLNIIIFTFSGFP